MACKAAPIIVFGYVMLMIFAMAHSVMYFRARPAILNMMCEADGDLLLVDIVDATYVLAWYELQEITPYVADLVWRYLFVYLSLGTTYRHPSVQRYSDLLNGPPLLEVCNTELRRRPYPE